MKAAFPIAATLLLAVGGCDQAKPRPEAAAAAAAAAAAYAPPAPTAALATPTGLLKRPEMAVFSLDLINQSHDPFNRPATIKAGEPTSFSGFGFDPVAKAAGKTIQIVVDGAAYETVCCQPRADVAAYYKNDAIVASGFRATLPAGVVKPGVHQVAVRVIAADGASYFDGATIHFEAK